MQLRAISEGLLRECFGDEIQRFNRWEVKMTKLYVYKQIIDFMGRESIHLTLSEQSPDRCTLTEAVCLGTLALDEVATNDSNDEVTK
jgi:hypothetical protein